MTRDPAEAGRRSGIARRAQAEATKRRIEERLEAKVDRAVDVYAEAMEAQRVVMVEGEPVAVGPDHSARIAGADRVTNRLFGMPTQAVEHSGSVELDVAAARDRLAVLIDRRDSATQ